MTNPQPRFGEYDPHRQRPTYGESAGGAAPGGGGSTNAGRSPSSGGGPGGWGSSSYDPTAGGGFRTPGGGSGHGGPPVCPRHPSVVSYVRCQRCGRPTCPECQRPASVGIQCVDCVREAQSRSRAPRTVAGARVRGGDPVVTYGIIGITVASFLLQMLLGSSYEQWGYFVPVLGATEPWRFLTTALLHVGIWHIVLNMYALYLVGPTLENVLGRARFTTLYVLSAIGGSVAVLLLADPAGPSWRTAVAGASGAVFGLFGALALTMRRMKRSDSQILIIIALNVVLGFVIPGVSWQGHIGGLITGSALAAVYLYAPRKQPTLWAVLASVAMAALLVVLSVAKYSGAF